MAGEAGSDRPGNLGLNDTLSPADLDGPLPSLALLWRRQGRISAPSGRPLVRARSALFHVKRGAPVPRVVTLWRSADLAAQHPLDLWSWSFRVLRGCTTPSRPLRPHARRVPCPCGPAALRPCAPVALRPHAPEVLRACALRHHGRALRFYGLTAAVRPCRPVRPLRPLRVCGIGSSSVRHRFRGAQPARGGGLPPELRRDEGRTERSPLVPGPMLPRSHDRAEIRRCHHPRQVERLSDRTFASRPDGRFA